MERRHIREFQRWINNDTVRRDESTLAALEEMRWDQESIRESFSADLEFGTSGLRGLLGVGTSRLNIYTVRKISQGLADYLLETGGEAKVVISRDSRRGSREFAEASAEVFAGNGISVLIFAEQTPVPVLSYAVRELGASAGVAITASHNPAEYNGYKVYNGRGYQITDREAALVREHIDRADIFDDIKRTTFDDALKDSLISYVPESVEQGYIEAVKEAAAGRLKWFRRKGVDFSACRFVYTPLFGSGYRFVRKLCPDINMVRSQVRHEGEFPGLARPDPECAAAFEEGIKAAERLGADAVLATDPDADRFGMAVRSGDGFRVLSGNEIAALFISFLRDIKWVPFNGTVIRSMVSSPLIDDIIARYPLNLRQTPSGFKYIGEALAAEARPGKFFFAFEENNGFLYGDYAMEKDGVAALYLAVAMLNRYRNPLSRLEKIYDRYGRWYNIAREYRGKADLGGDIRREPPDEEGCSLIDYREGSEDIPPVDMVKLEMADGSYAYIRPSGTEPKTKIYIYARTRERAGEISRVLYERIERLEGNIIEQESAAQGTEESQETGR